MLPTMASTPEPDPSHGSHVLVLKDELTELRAKAAFFDKAKERVKYENREGLHDCCHNHAARVLADLLDIPPEDQINEEAPRLTDLQQFRESRRLKRKGQL